MEEALVLIRMEIRSLSLLGVIIPRADKVQLELTALQLKKAENMFFVICIIHENNRHRSLYLHIYMFCIGSI